LLGEREMLKDTIKTSLSEKEVLARAEKIRKTRTELTLRQAKAVATLQIITERNTAAIGDFARTEEQLANRTRTMGQRLKAVAEILGKILLPIALKVVNTVIKLSDWFRGLSDSTRRYIVIAAGIAAVLGPAILFFGLFAKSALAIIGILGVLRAAFNAAGAAALLFQLKALAIPLALIALAAAIGLALNDIYTWFKGGKSVLGEWIGSWEDAKNRLAGYWQVIIDKWNELKSTVSGGISAAADFFGDFFGGVEQGQTTAAELAAPAPVIPAGGRGQISRTQNINVNSSVSVAVPEGTPEQQTQVVKEAAEKAVAEAWDKRISETSNEFPEVT
jgi:hypothetical protein